MKKAISVLLIIAVVALGAMHGHYTFLRSNSRIADSVGFWAYLMGSYKDSGARIAEGAAEKPGDSGARRRGRAQKASQARPETGETPVTAVEKAKPPKVEIDLSKIAGLIREGHGFYMKSKYKEAKERFDEAVTILTRADRKSHPSFKKAENYSKRSRVFEALVNNIPYLELSNGRDLWRIELETGRTIIARVINKDDDDNVTIKQNDGIEATLSYDQIDDMKQISPGEYRSQLKKKFQERLSNADTKAYFDMFSVAFYAIENQLHEEITPVLEKTFILPGSELVLQTFYTGDHSDELIVALLQSFDKTQEAQEYLAALNPPRQEPVHEPDPYETPVRPVARPEPVVQPVVPVGPPGSKKARIDEACRYFAAGQKLANLAVNNPPKRSVYGKRAHEELGKARDILNILQDQNPGDMEIENLLHQVSDLLHFVIHNLVSIR
jgi:hypothetical protein